MFTIVAYIATTTVVELSALQDAVTKAYPTTATVSLDLFDPTTGTAVTGATGLPLTYDNTTSGAGTIYRGQIPNTVALRAGNYPAILHISVGGNARDMQGLCTVRAG